MTHTKHLILGRAAALPLVFVLALAGCVSSGTSGGSGGPVNGAADTGSYRTYAVDVAGLAQARTEISFTVGDSLSEEMQWLSVQTACLGIYNMAQTGDWNLSDPYDYYQPNNIRQYLTRLSGGETKNTMFYGICFNYAQAAYDDIATYRSHYEGLGMQTNGWYIAAAFDNPGQIILFDPVSRDKATMTVNGVSVRENSRQNVRTHGGATRHAWLWVYGNDGTIYWIDPTWTDNCGYVVWGVVQNGEEVQMRPRQDLCVAPVSSNNASFEAANRGNASKNRGEWDRAIEEYNAALREDSTNVLAYIARGAAYDAKGDYDRAIADYTQAIRLDPNDATTYYNRGLAYNHKGDWDRAVADFTQAIRLYPNFADAYDDRGIAYQRKRDYDRAIADYTQAIRLDPNFAAAYSNRGVAYTDKGMYDQGIADCTEAIRLDPNYATAYYNRGNAHYDKADYTRITSGYGLAAGDYNRARVDYTEAIRLNPNYANAYANRGNAWGMMGAKNQARADWTKALQLDPNNEAARNNLAK